jgi:hypothetical protein
VVLISRGNKNICFFLCWLFLGVPCLYVVIHLIAFTFLCENKVLFSSSIYINLINCFDRVSFLGETCLIAFFCQN